MTGEYAMGIPGAAIGYCQALFGARPDPIRHTEYVRACLESVGAPWPGSHELFWGHKQTRSADDFLSDAIKPLINNGRVPILITSLDPAYHRSEIAEIISTRPAIAPGETVLVRLIMTSDQSINAIVEMTREMVECSQSNGCMPTWWPLLQGDLSSEQWISLKRALGELWNYINIAVNPFVPTSVLEIVWDQITVGQIPIGLSEGVRCDGHIELARGMKILGAGDGASYDMVGFMRRLSACPVTPTIIVLGPASPDWPDEWNLERLNALVPLLRDGTDSLWAGLPEATRKVVWEMER